MFPTLGATLPGRNFFDRESKKTRPALRKAGRSFSKSGLFVFKSQSQHLRRVGKRTETCPSEKKCDPLCARRVALFQVDPKKGVRPALHRPRSRKSNKSMYKSWRKAGRTHLGSWSYWEPIWHWIPLSNLAKSETLSMTFGRKGRELADNKLIYR